MHNRLIGLVAIAALPLGLLAPSHAASRRIVVSTKKVAKGKPLTVTVTGFKPRQKVTISLAGKVRFTGKADVRGIVSRTVKFAAKTKAGTQRVVVTSYKSKSKRDRTVRTFVRYR